jgi:hypothetical protein
MTRNTKILRNLRRTRFDYNHPVFYSRKNPAASDLDDDLARALHSWLSPWIQR